MNLEWVLAYPWALLALPLPLLVHWLLPAHREHRPGLVVPFLARLSQQTGEQPAPGAVVMRGGWLRKIALVLLWVSCVVALARPQLIEPPITRQVPVRDILLAVDLSKSMETPDFTDAQGRKSSRLDAVKGVLDDFISKRKGDRLGLVVFGSAPFVQVPFTEDLAVCRQLLDEATVGMSGPQTALGDAIGLAINVFDRSPAKEKVLIALTDGNDTASQVPPAKAGDIAKSRGIVIHTVAVGDPKAVGEDAMDVDTLKAIASTTGGTFASAQNRAQLEAIYSRLDALETHQADTITQRPRRDIYYWPLAFGMVVSFLQQAWQLAVARIRTRRVTPVLPAVQPTSA